MKRYTLAQVADMYGILPGILCYARQVSRTKPDIWPDEKANMYSPEKIQIIIDNINARGVFEKDLPPLEEIVKKEAKKRKKWN